jgi:hypothetical protein
MTLRKEGVAVSKICFILSGFSLPTPTVEALEATVAKPFAYIFDCQQR